MNLEDKLSRLNEILHPLKKTVVAFSGGVDSTFLLAAAIRALGAENVRAVTAVSASYSKKEKNEALALCEQLGVRHILIPTREFNDPAFLANTPLRCYHCKKIRFQTVVNWAVHHNIHSVIEGSNLDDCADYRPGMQAIAELPAVLSPLKEAEWTKIEIRSISKQWSLQTADKPANACLATRIEYNLPLTQERLQQVEDAEQFVARFCNGQLRVRHHGALARIEVEPQFISNLTEPKTAQKITKKLTALGFTHVALDLSGYKMGKMNQGVKS